MFTRRGRKPSSWRALGVLPVWIGSIFWMWSWWLRTERVNYLPLFIPLTLAMLYEFALLPSVFLYFVLKAKLPPKRKVLLGQKVAVITLCVPSKESIDIIEKQLFAMSEITYPHDSWVLDEGNSAEVRILAKKYGVKHFSRNGVTKYNLPLPPFKEKTKAGNVNAWLDHVKRRKYDFFVQFDIDHLAKPDYLHKTLRYFRDKKVAWVQAPSVYKNLSHWTARGSAEQELVLQGPLQMGFYGSSDTPFIIGSHCTYRTSAIKQIGGFQPTRAEDHLDTVALASIGYTGVFLPEVIAEGDGPETLPTYLAQQFAWAYSMLQVLFLHTPKLLKTMPWKKRLQFLFAQTWYPLWSLAYFVMFAIPVLALIINHEAARVQGSEFIVHFIPLFAASFLVWFSARPLMQPKNIGLSWRGMLLHVVRWPIILLAVISVFFRVQKPYMITPKGTFSKSMPSLATYRPFLFLGLVNIFAILYATIKYHQAAPDSQIFFAFSNAVFMLSICVVDLNLQLRQIKLSISEYRHIWLKQISFVMAVVYIAVGVFLGSPLFQFKGRAVHAKSQVSKASFGARKPVNQMTLAEVEDALSAMPAYKGGIPKHGLYNPANELSISAPYIQHVFVDWRDTTRLAQDILKIQDNGNVALVTLEPKITTGENVLEGITAGKYNALTQEIADILASSQQAIYIRFAHEMDLDNLYPWGNQDPAQYINAFRHMVQFMQSRKVSNVKWVWSPAGNVGSEAYYPGDDYVDVVGTTVLYDQHWYGENYVTFYDLAQQRFMLQKLGKPVWIVEFGAGNTDKETQARLVREAQKTFETLGFEKLLYLNIEDSNIPGIDYRLEDVSIFMQSFLPVRVGDINACELIGETSATSLSRKPNWVTGDVETKGKYTKPVC